MHGLQPYGPVGTQRLQNTELRIQAIPRKAGRLIDLIDSGLDWNIQHITIPYHLYKRR